MRAVIVLVYVAMALWLVIASVLRVQLLLTEGSALDPLPFIGGGLGVLALLLLAPAYDEWREHK